MKIKKYKKIIVAAVSVFLCICTVAASVIFIKRNKNQSIETSKEITAAITTSLTTAPTTTQAVTQTETTVTAATTAAPTTEKSTADYQKYADFTYYTYDIDGALPQKEAVAENWFDDAVFVGDSVSVRLSMYEASADRLGKAQFLTASSLSATNALWDVSDHSVHPTYNGKKQKVEDSIAQMQGIKKVYIMLGMNDIASVGLNTGIKNFELLCNKILEKSPNVQIYVQSVTPIINGSKSYSYEEGKLNNMTIYRYNVALSALAKKRGWYFVNVAEVMLDGNGYLNPDYCGDPEFMGLHFSSAGCKVWVDYLLTHTA